MNGPKGASTPSAQVIVVDTGPGTARRSRLAESWRWPLLGESGHAPNRLFCSTGSGEVEIHKPFLFGRRLACDRSRASAVLTLRSRASGSGWPQ